MIPHLTVTQGPAEDDAERAIAEVLPLRGRAREAILLAEVAPGRFETVTRFPFEGA